MQRIKGKMRPFVDHRFLENSKSEIRLIVTMVDIDLAGSRTPIRTRRMDNNSHYALPQNDRNLPEDKRIQAGNLMGLSLIRKLDIHVKCHDLTIGKRGAKPEEILPHPSARPVIKMLSLYDGLKRERVKRAWVAVVQQSGNGIDRPSKWRVSLRDRSAQRHENRRTEYGP